jgi:hypothetical protein
MGLYFIKIRKTFLQKIRNHLGKMMEKLLSNNISMFHQKVDRRKMENLWEDALPNSSWILSASFQNIIDGNVEGYTKIL